VFCDQGPSRDGQRPARGIVLIKQKHFGATCILFEIWDFYGGIYINMADRDSSVCIATRYGLDGLEIESW
jgi:hypothetical protein